MSGMSDPFVFLGIGFALLLGGMGVAFAVHGPGLSADAVSACVSACGSRGTVRVTPTECVCGASAGIEGDGREVTP